MAGLTLARMAVRELWISFRLLVLLALPLAAGLLALFLSSDPDLAPLALAWGMAGVGILSAGIAAAAWAGERRRGTAGWLSLRAVPRASILVGWFAGLSLPLTVGIAAGGLLVWLATGALASPPLDATSYATLVAVGKQPEAPITADARRRGGGSRAAGARHRHGYWVIRRPHWCGGAGHACERRAAVVRAGAVP